MGLGGDCFSYRGGSLQFVPIPIIDSESGYSGMFTLGSSRLESQLVAGSSFTLVSGSTNSLGGWSAMGVGLPKAVVAIDTAVIGGSGAIPV